MSFVITQPNGALRALFDSFVINELLYDWPEKCLLDFFLLGIIAFELMENEKILKQKLQSLSVARSANMLEPIFLSQMSLIKYLAEARGDVCNVFRKLPLFCEVGEKTFRQIRVWT